MEEEIISADTEQGDAGTNEEESGVEESGLEEAEVKEAEAEGPEAEEPEAEKAETEEPEAEEAETEEPEAKEPEAEQPEAEDPEVVEAEVEEAGLELSNSSPAKRGRGKSQGSKKLKVCVTDVNLTNLVSGISNGGSPQPKRGRGRPRLSDTKQTELQESEGDQTDDPVTTPKSPGRPKGSKNKTSNRNSTITDRSPKKRGRPKKAVSPETTAGEVLPNGGSNVPKKGRGRPKGSLKRKLESSTECEKNEGNSEEPRKRGRPKGSPNKKPRLKAVVGMEEEAEGNDSDYSSQDLSNGSVNASGRGRGRPRKIKVQKSSKRLVKRGRGRPQGSLNKKVHGKVGRPPKIQLLPPSRKPKRGRPRNGPVKRGRPRKNPVPSPEEQKKPKVWKVLGRPRKYPREDLPEGAPLGPRRSRGRPRKSESKKGAHLRMKSPTTPSTSRNPKDETPRKRGRPPSSAKSEVVTPKKRGRPKGSINKNTISNETVLDGELPDVSKETTDSTAVEEKEMNEDLVTLPIGNSSSTESEVASLKKRGRPKGSAKNKKVRSETQLDSDPQNFSIDATDSSAVEEKEMNENMEMSSIEGNMTPKPNDEMPRKRGRPPSSAKREVAAGKKRGRPKGSASKNKIGSESDSSAVGEKDVDLNIELMPIEDDAEEMLVDQDTGLEVSNQA